MTYISRYHLQNRWSDMTTYIMRYHPQRWRLGKHGIISATVEFFLGQRWRRTISSIISEMAEWFSRYHLQRWRLSFQGIISKIVGQRWLHLLWGIISRDDGLENKVSSLLLLNTSRVRDDGLLIKVSSPKSLVSDDCIYYEVLSPRMTAWKTRYDL